MVWCPLLQQQLGSWSDPDKVVNREKKKSFESSCNLQLNTLRGALPYIQHKLKCPTMILSCLCQGAICLWYSSAFPALEEHSDLLSSSQNTSGQHMRLPFVNILLNAKYYLPSYFRKTTGGIFDRRQEVSPPHPSVYNLHPPPSLASLGPRCVSRSGCKGYGLRLYIAQMYWIPGSVACHLEWTVRCQGQRAMSEGGRGREEK